MLDCNFNIQHYYAGSSLSRDEIIAIVSSISVFIVSSSLFFTFGYMCGHYRRKQEQKFSSVEKPNPVYEDVLPKDHEQNLELKSNIAYAPVHQL